MTVKRPQLRKLWKLSTRKPAFASFLIMASLTTSALRVNSGECGAEVLVGVMYTLACQDSNLSLCLLLYCTVGAGLLLAEMEGSRWFLCLCMAVSIMGSFSTSSSTHLASTMSTLGATGTSMSGSTGTMSHQVSSKP